MINTTPSVHEAAGRRSSTGAKADGPFVAIVAVVLVSLCALAARAAAAERLNFLLITVDDMNCDSIGVYGCDLPGVTPNIDRLASQSLRFDHAHVTIAVCQPTRAVWLTGRYPHRNGAIGFGPIDPGVPTLPETLRQAGYLTGCFAKNTHMLPSRGQAWEVSVKPSELSVGRDAQLFHKHAAAFFEQAKASGRPFFLAANAQDPHRPFAGSAHEAALQRGRRPGPATYPQPPKPVDPADVPLPGFLPDIPDVRTEIAEYFTSVRRADQVVGAVLAALDEAGLTDTTLVMFLSDHGMPLPFAKTNCYYHSTRTPWIIRWPGKTKPGTVDKMHMVSGIDLTPTVLDILGVQQIQGVDGRSFKPVLLGEAQDDRGHVFTHFHRTAGGNNYTMRSVLDRRYGYIYNGWSNGRTIFRNESQMGLTMKAMQQAAQDDAAIAARVELFLKRVPEELYDYANDPDALHNLIDDPAQQQRLAALRRRLLEHMQEKQDPAARQFERFLNAKGQ